MTETSEISPSAEPATTRPAAGCDDSCCGDVSMEQLLRELGAYSLEWTLDSVLDHSGDETLSRAEAARRISARTLRDPQFRDEVLRHPRWVYMVAMVEAFGISKMTFLRQIREVRVVEESETVLYFVLPVLAEREAAFFEEHLGGSVEPAATAPASDRETVERQVIADAQGDDVRRQALLFRPQATYLKTAKNLFGGELPAYLQGVKEIRVVPETPRSLALVVPTAG